MNDDYLTPDEVAERFRVSPRTILNWVHAKRIEGVRFSERVYRIPRSEVDRLEQRQRELTPPRQMLEKRPWQEVMGEYEHIFGYSTDEMLRRHQSGETIVFESVEDQRMYTAWLAAAEMAVSLGAIDASALTPAA